MKPPCLRFCQYTFASGLLLIAPVVLAAEPPSPPVIPLQVSLSPTVQQASGIVLTRLAASLYRPQIGAFARVMDLEPLLTLGARLQAAEALLAASQQEYRRQKRLNADDHNVSDKSLQAAEAAWQGSVAALAPLRAIAQQNWGRVIARWLEERNAPALEGFASGEERLLLVSVPGGLPGALPAARLPLDSGATADLVSAAPIVDPEIQAPAYFYRTSAALPLNLRIAVAMPLTQRTETAVRVPASAVVWYGGQAWVYVRLSATTFERRLIATDRPQEDGWFVSKGLAPGAQLVVGGAELLFAEEFKVALPKGHAGDEGDEDD